MRFIVALLSALLVASAAHADGANGLDGVVQIGGLACMMAGGVHRHR